MMTPSTPLKALPFALALLPGFSIDLLANTDKTGHASWYAMTSMTKSGERAKSNGTVAAHKQLPFGICLRVTNLKNDGTVVVRIDDRGPSYPFTIAKPSRRSATIRSYAVLRRASSGSRKI